MALSPASASQHRRTGEDHNAAGIYSYLRGRRRRFRIIHCVEPAYADEDSQTMLSDFGTGQNPTYTVRHAAQEILFSLLFIVTCSDL